MPSIRILNIENTQIKNICFVDSRLLQYVYTSKLPTEMECNVSVNCQIIYCILVNIPSYDDKILASDYRNSFIWPLRINQELYC